MTLTVEKVNEMIKYALDRSIITSSGGDSPKTNKVVGIDLLTLDVTEVGEGVGGQGDKIDTKVKPSDASLALAASRGDLTGLIGRFGASLGPAAVLAAIPGLIPSIVNELQRPGGFLDKRVRIDAKEESVAEIDRQTRQNTRIGDRVVRISQLQGFRANEGYSSTNTLALIRENADRVTDIGLFDRASGLSQGGR